MFINSVSINLNFINSGRNNFSFTKIMSIINYFKFIISIISIIFIIQINCKFNEFYRWKQITFKNPLDDIIIFQDDDNLPMIENMETINASETNYIAYNNVPMGATHYKNKLFITIPRRRPGVPSTLSYISTNATMGSSPALIPYPNLNMNYLHPQQLNDSNKIISVYRTRVDNCNRLWFIDTGLLEYPENQIQIQRPSIWIINLLTNKRIRRYEIPENIVLPGNGMASVTIDVESTDCENAFAYIPDLFHNQLYVYSLKEDRMWRFNHNFFNFDPLYGDFNVAGLQYQWNDGIFSITLGNINSDGFKTAYFHSMASISEFMVSTEILRNESLSRRSYHNTDFKLLGKRGANSQSAMHDYDENSGIIFYSQVGINGVSCWNTANEFSVKNQVLIAQNNETMIYPADLNVDSDGILWVLTNSMPIFLYSTLDTNTYNFRIWKQTVNEAVRGTVCSTKH